MNTRPTPETDAFAIKFKTTCGEKYWVPVDIARKLKRERDEWKALATQYSVEREHNAMQALTYKAERDEARGQRDRLAEALERIRDYQGLFVENDPQSIATEALQSITQPTEL